MIRELAKMRLLILLLAFASSISASEYQGGTQSPLRFGVGARELSLGGAVIARCDAATAPFWNPARLTNAEYLSFSGFHTQLFESDVTYQYAGIAVPTLDFGTIGLGIQRLGIDNIEQRDSDNLLTGHFTDNRFGFHVGYGRHWGAYQLGIAVGLEHHSLDTYSATSSPAVNMSAMRSFGSVANWCRDIDVVLSANNVLSSSIELNQESTSQPAVIEAGLSFDLFPELSDQHNFELSTRLTKINQIDMTAAAGLEYTYADVLSLRGGLRDKHWSAGIGLGYRLFNFDYAVVERELGILHMFAVTTTFGASVSERRVQRAEHREAEFQSRMHGQLRQRNSEAIAELMSSGRVAIESDLFSQAASDFDRALFIARSGGLDTTSIVRLLTDASKQRDQQQRLTDHNNYLDSAQSYFSGNDLLNARYFGGLAVKAYPESPDAISLIEQVNQMLKESEAREALMKDQVHQIDSLLTYGKYDDAIARATSLQDISPTDRVVSQLLKRARFERLRNQGDRAFAADDFELTLRIIDEAEKLFTEHQWSKSLRERVAQAIRSKQTRQPSGSPRIEVELTEASRKQAEDFYRIGQEAFERGAFEDAIASWEQVELLAPNYLSVRDYLVGAYKYLGVEYYSDNNLDRALAVWRRAVELMPGNQEIASYIKRTEAEMAKVRELSYGP